MMKVDQYPYEIIATLGPSSDRLEIWQAMWAAGATAFRLNTSHLTLEALANWLERLEPFLASLQPDSVPPVSDPPDSDPPFPYLALDLQGSKWRLGHFTPFDLVEGHRVEFVAENSAPPDLALREKILPVPHPDFFRAAPLSNGEIVLNDAKSRLVIESVEDGLVRARVTRGGKISPHKGITFVDCAYRQESLSEKDQAVLSMAKNLAGARCAISYVKDAGEMAIYRQCAGPDVFLIAKLERGPAMREAIGIAQACDEVWVCRGDLGAEIGLPAMARAVAQFSAHLRADADPRLPVLAIMAGQVLEHMTTSLTPTRSEVCYLWDALQSGYRGFVLSDETAIGLNPVESVRTAAMFRN